MMYVTYIHNWYVPRNALENAIQEFLLTQHRKLVPGAAVKDFKKMIAMGVENLNTKHSRCKPVTCSWWVNKQRYGRPTGHDDIRIDLSNHNVMIFELIQVPEPADQEAVSS